MIKRSLLRKLVFGIMLTGTAMSHAQTIASKSTAHVQTGRKYSGYEEMIRRNVSMFHRNFNNREFAKNGALVVDDLHVNSNGTELNGRDEFVKRIGRFVGPFPDVKITDLTTIVDGNTAAIRFIVTGTQAGDFEAGGEVIKATHKKVRMDGTEIFTFDQNGKLIDLLTIENLTQLLAELK